MPAKKNVVIVGGGGAGAGIARTLSQKLDGTKYNLTLVSAHPFYVHYIAGIRAVVTSEGSLEDQIFIPYDKLFVNNNGRFYQGTVTSIEASKESLKGGKVFLEDGEAIDYDVLVLAPGSKWEAFLNFPYDAEKTRLHVREWRERFRDADKIAIAGGGAVGIELAGEIREYYPNKKVTLVHADKQLLNATYPNKFRKDIERRVRKSGVRLILDDYVDSFPASETRHGVPLDADLVVPARGPRPNTSWIATSLGKDVVTDRGFIRIQPTLQLTAYPSIFAIGDVIDYPEQKQVAKVPGHVAVVAANIASILSGAEPKKEYKGGVEAIFVTLGKRGGAGYLDLLWGLMFGNWVVAFAKSKGLFISMSRKNLGYSS